MIQILFNGVSIYKQVHFANGPSPLCKRYPEDTEQDEPFSKDLICLLEF